MSSLSALGEDTKIRSPQTAGVAPLKPGSGVLQRTPSEVDHCFGKPVSSEEPSNEGPRHCGQFEASALKVRRERPREQQSSKGNRVERIKKLGDWRTTRLARKPWSGFTNGQNQGKNTQVSGTRLAFKAHPRLFESAACWRRPVYGRGSRRKYPGLERRAPERHDWRGWFPQ